MQMELLKTIVKANINHEKPFKLDKGELGIEYKNSVQETRNSCNKHKVRAVNTDSV